MAESHEAENNEIQRQLLHFQRLLNSDREINEQERESFKELLHTNPELFEALDSQQQSLLHLASANGHIEIVKILTAAEIHEPEINEDVTSLHEENEYNLDTATVKNCFNWTSLHVAASRGQQELFQALLKSNPEVAEARDSQQRSLLHLASANGHIEIVKLLIVVRPEMCLARDQDGANPLHVAAMRGKVDVLDELFQANPHAARAYRVDRGEKETILHLCVKYNQLQFLSMLLKKYFKGKELVNATDNAGNTILHLAVADRRYEVH